MKPEYKLIAALHLSMLNLVSFIAACLKSQSLQLPLVNLTPSLLLSSFYWKPDAVLQSTEGDVLATGMAPLTFENDQQHLQELSSVLRAETGLWLQFYNEVFSTVSLSFVAALHAVPAVRPESILRAETGFGCSTAIKIFCSVCMSFAAALAGFHALPALLLESLAVSSQLRQALAAVLQVFSNVSMSFTAALLALHALLPESKAVF